MTRWRPPAPYTTALITPEGHARLKQELDHLWRQLRPEIVAALAAAAAEGDRSENAEYAYRKKQLGETDRRIRYLTRRLPALRIVREPPSDPQAIFFGAWFSLEDARGDTTRYRIVGPDEIDPARGWISIDSPLARAALRHRAGQEIQVALPTGIAAYCVSSVGYQDPDRN